MKSYVAERMNQRLDAITATTLIVGIDIAKAVHWARFVDYRGIEVGKPFSFRSDRQGFERIVAKIEEIRNSKVMRQRFDNVLIGMEPTGHYWKTAASHFMKVQYRVVCVNPHHTKKSKELDDNSPTANDKKDAITIARLVKNGSYFEPYLPQGVYAELRNLTNARVSTMKRSSAVKNTITAIMDEYFPEFCAVFKKPLKGKASRQILRSCPFPAFILELGEVGVLAEIKKAVKKSVGKKKVLQLIEVAENTVGADYGLDTARFRLRQLLDELEMYERHVAETEVAMEQMLNATGYAEQILSIKGIGVVTAAGFLGEIGDPLRFQNARQIANYAGYNLTEDSSGKSKSGTKISKRGRSQLRALLYQMAFTMVGKNAELKALHKHLTTRQKNPLKKKQSLVVISKKIITVIYSLLKKQATYDPALVLGTVRREMMQAA
ncbi:MAG: IS110 family transposase [Oscillospiraceae bacterium]|nr:IS110 family transposase [Oscillospiraceae bacterium]